MTFADGVHHCLGAPIGHVETRIVVEEVLRAMPAH
jgi:cytochrome P450